MTITLLRDLRALAKGSPDDIVAISKKTIVSVFDLAEQHLVSKARKRVKKGGRK